MRKLLLFFMLLVCNNLFCQKDSVFSELQGLDDQFGNTHLFYRIQYSLIEDNLEANGNDLYHLDLTNNLDTLFLPDGGRCYSGIFCNSLHVTDVEFWHNNPTTFIYGGISCGIDCDFFIKRYDQQYPSFGGVGGEIHIQISRQNDSLIYANAYRETFKSNDGGLNWNIFLPDTGIISINPLADSILFGFDINNNLLRSENSGVNFNIVDTSFSFGISSKFYYDIDNKHIYYKNGNVLKVSDQNGKEYSWQTIPLPISGEYAIICLDPSKTGSIYISQGKNIFYSNNYGSSFSLYETLSRNIIGIYKKPYSSKLYVATKFQLLEFDGNKSKVIKQLKLATEIFSYYPLSKGNKWIYKWDDWSYPNYEEGIVTVEALGDSIFSNGNRYYKIKGLYNNIYYERVDSLNGKILRYKDSTDIVIDDLLAEPGDTLFIFNRFIEETYAFTLVENNQNIQLFSQNIDSKHFQYYSLVYYDYYLSKQFGLSKINYGYDFGTMNYTLKGCIIDGKSYGDTTTVGVEENKTKSLVFSLSQNYPNPFNPRTVIRYRLPVSSKVLLKVYDVLGNEVATLVNEEKPAGNYEVEFDGSKLSSGIYFYVLKAGENRFSRKMCLIK